MSVGQGSDRTPGIEEVNTFLLLESRGHTSVFLTLSQKMDTSFYHPSMTLPHWVLPASEAFAK